MAMGFYPNIHEARADLKANLALARQLKREINFSLHAQQREAEETIRRSRRMINDSLRLLRELDKQGI
jgi:hypothetical protein